MSQSEKTRHSPHATMGSHHPASESRVAVVTMASFEIASIGLGYRALDLLTRMNSVQIIEASVVAGGRFLILAEGEAHEFELLSIELRAALEGSGENTRGAVLDHEILSLRDRTLLESIYSLSQSPLAEALIVIECETVSALLASLQLMQANHQIQIIESKFIAVRRWAVTLF